MHIKKYFSNKSVERANNLNSNCNCSTQDLVKICALFKSLKAVSCHPKDNERQLKWRKKNTKSHYFIQFAGEHWHWGYKWFGAFIWIEHGENLCAWELWAWHAILCCICIRSWFGKKWHCHLSLIQWRFIPTIIKYKPCHHKLNHQQSLQYRFTYGSFNAIASSWLWNIATSYVNCYCNWSRWTSIVFESNDFLGGARCQW